MSEDLAGHPTMMDALFFMFKRWWERVGKDAILSYY
jgi:hypothetical protein